MIIHKILHPVSLKKRRDLNYRYEMSYIRGEK